MMRGRRRYVLPLGLLVLLLNASVGSLVAKYTIEYWVRALSGREATLSWPVALAVGLIGGEVIIPTGLVTLIISGGLDIDRSPMVER
ncbi:MAG TPA: hypothetical protein VF234_07730 [Limnochordia bacterium]